MLFCIYIYVCVCVFDFWREIMTSSRWLKPQKIPLFHNPPYELDSSYPCFYELMRHWVGQWSRTVELPHQLLQGLLQTHHLLGPVKLIHRCVDEWRVVRHSAPQHSETWANGRRIGAPEMRENSKNPCGSTLIGWIIRLLRCSRKHKLQVAMANCQNERISLYRLVAKSLGYVLRVW